ncbi:MAG: CHRD domain-containing protein [Acidobacteriota bacterium]|nr:CHRD domain-containing protein [Acidobacteriota bacterium]
MKVKILVATVLILITLIVVIPQVMNQFSAQLTGYQEVPAVSTVASGAMRARITDDQNGGRINFEGRIQYELSYANLEGNV